MKINEKNAFFILNKCLESGADFSEIFFEDTITQSIFFENKNIENIKKNNYCGIGLRLIKKNKSVYGYTNEIKKSNILELIEKLSNFFKLSKEKNKNIKKCKKIKQKKIKNISPIKKSFFKTPIYKKIEILKIACETMKNYSPIIKNATCIFNSTKKKIKIYNSNGLYVKDSKERNRIILKAIGNIENKYETIVKTIGKQYGMDFFYNLNIKKIANEVAKDTVNAINAKKCPAGEMTVIVGNDNGVLFHEACGHALEANFLSKNLSIFANKIGKKIASPLITLYDDGTIPHAWGSNNIDDEGNITKKNCLIKNGILVNYLVDDFNSSKIKIKSNGTCRREDYTYEPTSRMSNTFIENGKSTFEEIINKTKYGLYAKKLGGGSVQPSTGEFEFSVDIGYIVKNGKIIEQVKGATLIGKCNEIIKNIDMVGNDLNMGHGFCGADSGYVPVEDGQPTIRIKKMLVGGSETNEN